MEKNYFFSCRNLTEEMENLLYDGKSVLFNLCVPEALVSSLYRIIIVQSLFIKHLLMSNFKF